MKKTHLLAATALVATVLLGAQSYAAPAAETMTHQATTMAQHGVKHTMKPEWSKEDKELFQEMKAKREELHKLARAPEFDKAAYVAKSEELAALRAKMAKAHIEEIADKLASMTAEERAKLPEGGPFAKMHKGMQGKMKCPMMPEAASEMGE